MRQFSKTQRRLAVGAFLLTAGPVALGSVAYACQSLATLHANPASVAAGGTVTVYGRNYSTAAAPASSNPAGPVEIHLNGRNGPLLATFTASGPTREINGTVTIPNTLAAGTHTLVATQFLASGDMVSGAPGRASVTVTAAGRTATAGPVADAQTATTPQAAPVAVAGPVAGTPEAAPAASAPAASVAAPAASGAPTAGTAAPVANAATPAAADAATTGAATVAPAAPGAAALAASAPDASSTAPAASAPALTSGEGLIPASSGSTSALPGLTLAVGLALVLLSLGAFVKSGRTIMGGRGFTPLAG